LLFSQISCEESNSDETVRGPQLQIAELSSRTDVNDTEKWMTGSFNGTHVNGTGNWMTGSYNGTEVNETGTLRIKLLEGSKGISLGNWRVGGANAKHHGNHRWRGQWNCNGTCANNTLTRRRAICNGTCANRTCG
jgi:hypothetical protein